jgi:DNA-binding transcriptional ArsR family regulator
MEKTMRPLFHPAIEDVPVETILHALSDPVRVAIFADIVGQDCTQKCSSFSHLTEKAIPKSTLSQHFRILREAGLIRGERMGVEMHNVSRCAEVEARYPGLLSAITAAYGVQMAEAARRVKSTAKKRGLKG